MIRTLDRVTTRKQLAPKRSAKAFNPLARDEAQLFRALLDGQHMIRGFYNPDIRNKLKDSPHLKEILDPRRQSAKVTRIFNRCHAHGLIAKIPHSRRWRLAHIVMHTHGSLLNWEANALIYRYFVRFCNASLPEWRNGFG